MTFDVERARRADLIQLPPNITGTNCGNCEHFDNGYCDHKLVKMNVSPNMCCFYWSRPDAPLAKPLEKSPLMSIASRLRHIQSSISRFNLDHVYELVESIDNSDAPSEQKEVARSVVSRFSECGHTPEGDFDYDNTCASLRGKGEGGKSEHHEIRAKHHEDLANHHAAKAEHHRKRAEKLAEHAMKSGSLYDSERAHQLSERSKDRAQHHEAEQGKEDAKYPAKTSAGSPKSSSGSSEHGNKQRSTGVTNDEVRGWQEEADKLRSEIDEYKDAGEGNTPHAKHLEDKMGKIYDKIVAARETPGSGKKESPKSDVPSDRKKLVDKANDAYKRMKQAKSSDDRKRLKAEWEGHLAELDKAKSGKSEPKPEIKPESKSESKHETKPDNATAREKTMRPDPELDAKIRVWAEKNRRKLEELKAEPESKSEPRHETKPGNATAREKTEQHNAEVSSWYHRDLPEEKNARQKKAERDKISSSTELKNKPRAEKAVPKTHEESFGKKAIGNRNMRELEKVRAEHAENDRKKAEESESRGESGESGESEAERKRSEAWEKKKKELEWIERPSSPEVVERRRRDRYRSN